MPTDTTSYNGKQMGTAMASFLSNNPQVAAQSAQLAPVPQPSSAAVVNSRSAQADIGNIQSQHADIQTGMANQANTMAAYQAAQDAQNQAARDKAAADQQAQQKLAIDKQAADAKSAAMGYVPESAEVTQKQSEFDYARQRQDQLDQDYQAKADEVTQTLNDVNKGVIPLNAGEQAQVAGLTAQFQELIKQQQLANVSAQGTANIRGYQTGAAEYDPSFQVKTIGSIITAGTQKVADLNIKMASAVAELTQKFRDNDIKGIKESWDVYSQAADKRRDALAHTMDKAQEAIKSARDEAQKKADAIAKAEADAKKAQYDQVTKPINDILLEASKNGATPEQMAAIQSAKTPGEAIQAAGDSLQTGSGIVSEFLYYRKQALAAGQVPMDFNSYQNMDANRKRSVTNISMGGSDLSPKEATVFNALTDKFNKSPLTAAYNRTTVLQGTIDNVKKDPSNAAQQLALAYGYIQALDTYQSSVREGELGLVNSIDSKTGQLKNYAEQMANGQIMRPEVAKQIASAAQTLVDTIKTGAEQTQKKFVSQASINGKNVGNAMKQYIGTVNEVQGQGSTADNAVQTEDQAKQKVTSTIKSNPEAYKAVRPLIVEGYSYGDIQEALPEFFK